MSIDRALADMTAQIGTEVGVSKWIGIDQTMIDQFAQVTHDDQWIHVDTARAAETDLGGTIAHGFLTLSLASRFAYDCFPLLPGQHMGINYGFNRLRFLTPVRPGHRVRGRFTLINTTKRTDTEILRTLELTIEIADVDTPALVAEWLGLALFLPEP
ncbi:MaoC family dehydratase [Tateyamaria omphalii]|uniref:MaoC family dehydratase n=1 Tax=Tateyamaria omphalii TaxID=299262 RepID=UPI001C99EADA|nr:MaoC family dehydratase [Tateyamaria omphalii]MBY5932552.1 MaoC family dehydratase [Tateyamaria omphalii]